MGSHGPGRCLSAHAGRSFLPAGSSWLLWLSLGSLPGPPSRWPVPACRSRRPLVGWPPHSACRPVVGEAAW
eukprot:335975-Lingulodinium_polyedra.AAC.1